MLNSGGKILYNSLIKNNVKHVFGYSGGSVMPLIDCLHSDFNNNIKLIVNTNELNTGLSAKGYAHSSDETGVCLVTSGPGITNMITPILDAKNDNIPMVVISGQVNINNKGTRAFQEAPACELTKDITKWNYSLDDINEMEHILDEAFKVANNGRKGPVHIDVPKCVNYQELLWSKTTKSTTNQKETITISENNIKKIANIINSSEKPILYIGAGCINASYELRLLAKLGNIPVTSTIHANGVFDDYDDLSLRWCGMHGYAPANYSLQEADTIIAIGSRFDDRTTGNIQYYAPNAFKAYKEKRGGIIHINIDPDELNFVIDTHYNICADSKDFISNILPFINHKKRTKWLKQISELKRKHPFVIKSDPVKLHMENVLDRLNSATRRIETVFTTGVGNHQMQTYQFIKSQTPRKIISSGSLGVMGAGLPYAIGAQLANPKKLVINIDGDSSFNMTLTDMKTIVENNLPVKIAVMNNNSQMMVTIWEKLFFEERYTATSNNNNPDYCKLAESFGINSIKCDNAKNLDNTINQIINSNGPLLVEFKIEKDICLPLVGPGNALDDMLLEDVNTKLKGLSPS